ncbi:MAG: sigma-70 family RNA polymerase sigma factor [Austwickia sp.]|nr:sigma-70 family RNA polymerase sigma factor [Austwickia sp.]MCO5309378.1 sigma-70 family RNA polymerase sigma factor [Austwickia sp.]
MAGPATVPLAARAGAALSEARAGDGARMAELVQMLTPMLWHIARAAGIDHQSAEDAVQHAWLKLLEHLDDLDRPEAVVGWLATTVRRESWRVSSAARRTLVSDETAEFEDPRAALARCAPPDPGEGLLTCERDDALWRHVRALSPRCQALLRAVCLAERPDYAAIGAALGMPIGSIGPTRGRCLATLRAALLADPSWSER